MISVNENFTSGVAKKIAADKDAAVFEALGVDKEEALVMAKDRLTRIVQADRETILLDGMPLVTFEPIKVERMTIDGVEKIVATQRYTVHDRQAD